MSLTKKKCVGGGRKKAGSRGRETGEEKGRRKGRGKSERGGRGLQRFLGWNGTVTSEAVRAWSPLLPRSGLNTNLPTPVAHNAGSTLRIIRANPALNRLADFSLSSMGL